MDFTNVNVKKDLKSPTKTAGPGTLTNTQMVVKAANTLTVGTLYYLECTGPSKTYTGTFAGTDPADKTKLLFNSVQ